MPLLPSRLAIATCFCCWHDVYLQEICIDFFIRFEHILTVFFFLWVMKAATEVFWNSYLCRTHHSKLIFFCGRKGHCLIIHFFLWKKRALPYHILWVFISQRSVYADRNSTIFILNPNRRRATWVPCEKNGKLLILLPRERLLAILLIEFACLGFHFPTDFPSSPIIASLPKTQRMILSPKRNARFSPHRHMWAAWCIMAPCSRSTTPLPFPPLPPKLNDTRFLVLDIQIRACSQAKAFDYLRVVRPCCLPDYVWDIRESSSGYTFLSDAAQKRGPFLSHTVVSFLIYTSDLTQRRPAKTLRENMLTFSSSSCHDCFLFVCFVGGGGLVRLLFHLARC